MQEKDRVLQEARLQADEKIEAMRLLSEHTIAKHEAALANQPKEKEEKTKMPDVIVHNNISVPSSDKEIVRGKDGLITEIKSKKKE